MNYVYFKEKIMATEALQFQDFHRLRYGDSLFESMLAVNGRVPLLNYHIKRLLHSCQYLQLDFPTIDLSKAIEQLLAKNQLKDYARLRLTVFRAEGKLYSPKGSGSLCLIEAEAFAAEKLFKPVKKVGVYSENKKPLSIYSLLKSGNALHYVIAKQFAQSKGFDEALLMNPNTEIIEGASNNVFFIFEDKIYTPSTATGCVNGVFKKFLTTEIIENINYAACLQDDLERFDEIFLTNAVGLIQPVLQYKEKQYKTKKTEDLIQQVKEKLKV